MTPTDLRRLAVRMHRDRATRAGLVVLDRREAHVLADLALAVANLLQSWPPSVQAQVREALRDPQNPQHGAHGPV